MQTFQVDQKTLLGLVLPDQYCQVVVRKKSREVFGLYYITDHSHTFNVPNIRTVLSYCMIRHLMCPVVAVYHGMASLPMLSLVRQNRRRQFSSRMKEALVFK